MGVDFDSSWSRIAPQVLSVVQVAREAAVSNSVGYTALVLAETAQKDDPVGTLVPSRFMATAPNGMMMGDLLDTTVIKAKVAVSRGASPVLALEQAGAFLSGLVLTVMADTGRSVVGADIAQRPAIAGYVRMLTPPSCGRCVILAGKFYRWNAGFRRHPKCDCIHVPSSENIGGDLRTDPYEYFNSLSPDAQDKLFRPTGKSRDEAALIGKSNARAIRDGGDIYRVENITQRGLSTAKARAQFGTPTRTTVDDIYRTAGTRTNALRMMRDEGYITGTQVVGGNVFGQRVGFGQLGKGGKARAASDAVLKANASGVRDPLNRYTMTAAERRLFDANYRLAEAKRTGNWPMSIGANSADKYSRPNPLKPGQLALLQRNLDNEVARLRDPRTVASVRKLAKLLGL